MLKKYINRAKRIVLDRIVGQCQAAIAEAVEAFSRVDVLLSSTSEGKPYTLSFFNPCILQSTNFYAR